MKDAKKTSFGLLITTLGLICTILSLTVFNDSTLQLPIAILAVIIILIGLFVMVKKNTNKNN